MQLRDGKPKSTSTLNEAAESNALEGESKKDKALRFQTKDEINEIITVLLTQANTNTKKHPKFYNWDSVYEISESDPPQLIRKQVTKKKAPKVVLAVSLVVVAVEDMFDRCLEIHKRIRCTGYASKK